MEKINKKQKEDHYYCSICGDFHSRYIGEDEIESPAKQVARKYGFLFIKWIWELFVRFLRWLWSHPKKLITSILAAIGMWLMSFLNFKLPKLPFSPNFPVEISKKEDNKPQEKQTEQSKTNVTTITNTISQTNFVTQTNFVSKTNTITETKYITNFVVQPIVVTNTVFKEVPVTVTNVLIIKNNTTETNNKTAPMNGPAFFFTDDFNTLLQNQQQNPIRARMVNPN
jgi:hypothetical protein